MDPAKIPAWVTETPPDHGYELVMMENDDGSIQEIPMTRAEYLALKAHLAAMRGYGAGDFRAKVARLVDDGPEGYYTSDKQQLARYLQTARDFYRHCPGLVIQESSELDEHLEELDRD